MHLMLRRVAIHAIRDGNQSVGAWNTIATSSLPRPHMTVHNTSGVTRADARRSSWSMENICNIRTRMRCTNEREGRPTVSMRHPTIWVPQARFIDGPSRLRRSWWNQSSLFLLDLKRLHNIKHKKKNPQNQEQSLPLSCPPMARDQGYTSIPLRPKLVNPSHT
ncbi:uncharacterized protein K489DRAFT_58197 [Dissoconium aciculare CBS 342.82]|uniref:Uncharacterized protein n=1 Tax=Dissoconium aciculare CBS 342.82 TaxID=1314786 RepID=A0A6J3LVG6_9PEZI|nr:uncharacterized protein K489DRAFT_58197 [Dissoconium aciculare CBS 342.82]KAF1819755.1 hypothetical protein K489DRAFT_58197 [Dissoconium aciculare CBS 342.82]